MLIYQTILARDYHVQRCLASYAVLNEICTSRFDRKVVEQPNRGDECAVRAFIGAWSEARRLAA